MYLKDDVQLQNEYIAKLLKELSSLDPYRLAAFCNKGRLSDKLSFIVTVSCSPGNAFTFQQGFVRRPVSSEGARNVDYKCIDQICKIYLLSEFWQVEKRCRLHERAYLGWKLRRKCTGSVLASRN